MLPQAQALERYAQLAGRNQAFARQDADSREARAKLELQQELQRQRREMEREKRKREGGWWKRALGSALPGLAMGLATGNPLAALGGALAGGLGSVANDKLLGGEMGPGFGMQLGGAVSGGLAERAARNAAPQEAQYGDFSNPYGHRPLTEREFNSLGTGQRYGDYQRGFTGF